MSGKVSCVIFDMDGVIFDTERIYLESCEQAAKNFGLGDIHELAMSCIGITAKMTIQKYVEHFGSEEVFKSFWEEAKRLTMIEFDRGIPLKPGVRELLQYLAAEKIPAVLASSSVTDVVKRELAGAGILDCFGIVVGGDQVRNSKPDPEIFLRAAEFAGAEKESCIVIEDSYNGIRAAYSAGMRPLMVPDLLQPDEEILSKAEIVLESLYDVKAYLQKQI